MLAQISFLLGVAVAAPTDTQPPVVQPPTTAATTVRPKSIEYSDAYYTRLTIHRIGSYAMLPLFGAEYLLGERLLTSPSPESWLKPTHLGVALGIGALFTSNTVTGLWNLWDSRHDPNDRGRRLVHSGLLLSSEAGFLLASSVVGGNDGRGSSNRTLHKNIALGSMAVSTIGTAIMWLRRN